METIYQKVKEVLSRTGVPVTTITAQAHLQQDLGLDSLDVTELSIYLEDAFHLEISEEEVHQFATVEGVV